VALLVAAEAANQTVYDPVDMTLADGSGTRTRIFKDIPAREHFVDLMNGDPGVNRVEIFVNGTAFEAKVNTVNATRADVGAAMLPGGNNTILVRSYGPEGGTVWVLLHD
jgi:hypothetical protein